MQELPRRFRRHIDRPSRRCRQRCNRRTHTQSDSQQSPPAQHPLTASQWNPSCQNVFGRQCLNRGKSEKVCRVKSQQVLESMSLHGGNQPCVMGQLAMNGILDHEFIPVRKDPALIAQQCETGQQITNLQIDGGNGQPKTVDCCWPRCDNPVFINRLRHKAEIAASIAQLNQGCSSSSSRPRMHCAAGRLAAGRWRQRESLFAATRVDGFAADVNFVIQSRMPVGPSLQPVHLISRTYSPSHSQSS